MEIVGCDTTGIGESALRSIRLAAENFSEECDALKACEDSRSTPSFYASEERVQGPEEIYPGKSCRIIMSKVPGSSLMDMLDSLPFKKLAFIRTKLTEILQ